MTTKLVGDIAEQAFILECLKNGMCPSKPCGDRMPYDVILDTGSKLLKIQVKSAWFVDKTNSWVANVRMSKTNRKVSITTKYSNTDFDVAAVYVPGTGNFYHIPVVVFNSYASAITLPEIENRQRSSDLTQYRNNWDIYK